MPLLTAHADDALVSAHFHKGLTLRAILDATAMRVRSGCRGTGACGLCRIKVLTGNGNEPTPNERLQLSADQLANGIRLACQWIPEGDVTVQVINPAPPSDWKSLEQEILRPASSLAPSRSFAIATSTPLGLAVDLGTSNISISLYDLVRGKRLSERHGVNPQCIFGADVMTRLVAASDSRDTAQRISDSILVALAEALHDIGSREGIDLSQVIYLTVVGNTAMLSLLSGAHHHLLLSPEMWEKPLPPLPPPPASWSEQIGLHQQARIELIPPLAGFVGSDLLAGLLALRLIEEKHPALFLDFGTNTEIALWDGRRLLVTSAAGGPAFESCGISCGMPAEAGALYRVANDDSRLSYSVIQNVTPPQGICGSGLVDLVACLCQQNSLNERGRLRDRSPEGAYRLPHPAQDLRLTARDIDMLQRAKAAVASGIMILLNKAGMRSADLSRVCLAGAFGKYLRVASAKAIGLLPNLADNRFELCGNTALSGCEDLLLSSEAADRVASIRANAHLINLSRVSEFDDLFFSNLFLRPIPGE